MLGLPNFKALWATAAARGLCSTATFQKLRSQDDGIGLAGRHYLHCNAHSMTPEVKMIPFSLSRKKVAAPVTPTATPSPKCLRKAELLTMTRRSWKEQHVSRYNRSQFGLSGGRSRNKFCCNDLHAIERLRELQGRYEFETMASKCAPWERHGNHSSDRRKTMCSRKTLFCKRGAPLDPWPLPRKSHYSLPLFVHFLGACDQ